MLAGTTYYKLTLTTTAPWTDLHSMVRAAKDGTLDDRAREILAELAKQLDYQLGREPSPKTIRHPRGRGQ